jgi:hypothetical protein
MRPSRCLPSEKICSLFFCPHLSDRIQTTLAAGMFDWFGWKIKRSQKNGVRNIQSQKTSR